MSKGDIPKQLGEWIKSTGTRARGSLKKGFSDNFGDFDLRKVDLKNVSEYSPWIRMGLLILGLWFAANLVSRVIGLVARPVYTSLPKRSGVAQTGTSGEDYDSILHRNIFNVEGKIPDPFDQGRLDCFAQARPTTQRIQLLGTIVMNDDKLSTALVEEEGGGVKIGVRKDDPFFDGKYIAMKVERKKLCFQVRSTQDFEFIEIPDESDKLGVSASPVLSGGGDGIVAKSENEFEVKKTFLDKSLMNLTELLQTARAVPYNDETGKMKGFLIQSIDPSSPFAQLGLHQGDVLTSVNNIPLDNPGRGLEAFQMLRSAASVHLSVIRGGQQMQLSYNLGS